VALIAVPEIAYQACLPAKEAPRVSLLDRRRLPLRAALRRKNSFVGQVWPASCAALAERMILRQGDDHAFAP